MRTTALALCIGALMLSMPAAASAAGPLGLPTCADSEGVQQCSGLVRTWDGVPLDTTVTLPPGGGRDLPLVALIHGFGNSKHEYLGPPSRSYTDNAVNWAKQGYAVLTYTARGLWGSCGTLESRLASPIACARGYIHLADHRYEVRDTQELIGRLVDEGVADADRIGVTGDSYGGGQSIALAALNDRVMLPDDRLVPWRTPAGTPLRLAAAAPVIPWTDLVAAIAPNGRTRANGITPERAVADPVGVFKGSFAVGVFASATLSTGPGQPVGEPQITGRPIGYLAPPGLDPRADVTAWVLRSAVGDPYGGPYVRRIVDEIERHHSAYRIPSATPPPPLFMASGSTDDFFPVDEATRFLNRMRRDHPDVPQALLWGDFGHQRAANKPADRDRLVAMLHAWFDHHVRGDGPEPEPEVTATTQTCPKGEPPAGPFTAPTFGGLAAGTIRERWHDTQTVLPLWGNPLVALAIDPVTGGGDACATTAADPEPGTAAWEIPAGANGFTLIGAPVVKARIRITGLRAGAQLAARLWDVAPGGESQTLVARGAYRPTGRGRERFELHPNAYRFGPGHTAKLQLLGADMPFLRFANLPFLLYVNGLELQLPARAATG